MIAHIWLIIIMSWNRTTIFPLMIMGFPFPRTTTYDGWENVAGNEFPTYNFLKYMSLNWLTLIPPVSFTFLIGLDERIRKLSDKEQKGNMKEKKVSCYVNSEM